MRMRRLHCISPESLAFAVMINLQLGVLVLAVDRQMLADGNSLLDEHVKILRDLGGKA